MFTIEFELFGATFIQRHSSDFLDALTSAGVVYRIIV